MRRERARRACSARGPTSLLARALPAALLLVPLASARAAPSSASASAMPALAAPSASASASTSTSSQEHDDAAFVIEAGSESAVQRALGLGVVLGGGCLLGDTTVDRGRIDASYRCVGRDAPAHLSLTHVAGGGAGDTQVTADGAGVPDALVAAVRARLAVEKLPWQARAQAVPSARPGEPTKGPSAVAPAPGSAGTVRFVDWLPALVVAFAALGPLCRRRAPLPSLGHGVATCLAALLGLHALGDAIVLASAHLLAATAVRLGWLLLAALLVLVSAFVFRRAPRTPRERWLAVAFAALTFAGHYALGLARVRAEERALPTLAGVPAARPPGLHDEPYPGRPRVAYAIGARGFRGPSFELARAPGTLRVALIGDSFVYGSGVEGAATLSEQLAAAVRARHPERAIEVLNLGVPGTNLPSHVQMYEAATKALDPSAIVVCLTLPNDLSDAGGDVERAARGGVGRFSLAAAAIGPPLASWVTGVGTLATDFDARALAVLRRETARLGALRSAPSSAGASVPLFFFTYAVAEPRVAEALATVPGAILVEPLAAKAEHYIPGDGHPTAEGNRAFAARLAEALERSSVMPR